MAWTVEFDIRVEKDLRKLGHTAQKKILRYIKEKLIPAVDPRVLGKPLLGDLSGLWRYCIGDYRMIARIEDEKLVILVVQVGHRKNIYDLQHQ